MSSALRSLAVRLNGTKIPHRERMVKKHMDALVKAQGIELANKTAEAATSQGNTPPSQTVEPVVTDNPDKELPTT